MDAFYFSNNHKRGGEGGCGCGWVEGRSAVEGGGEGGASLLCVDQDSSVTFSRGRSLTHVRV